MRLVVDTNILFSFFWRDSFTKKLLTSKKFDLISPEMSLKEIKKYSKYIMKKTKIDKNTFTRNYNEMKKFIRFINEKEYFNFLKEATKISPDKADSHFFALCLKNKYHLWSKDSLLKKQNKVKVFSTEDIIELLLN